MFEDSLLLDINDQLNNFKLCTLQEAQVLSRVAELRKEGLWSSRRLPKVQEPPRPKAHWDYLLEEMQWLAADFHQERKWKKTCARKVSSCPFRK